MITIDPSKSHPNSAGKLKKSSKKELRKKTDFACEVKTKKNSANSSSKEINEISSMLFLQEIDQYSSELQNLKDFADRAFQYLKDLQLSLIKEDLSKVQFIQDLKNFLSDTENKYHNAELLDLANEIKTRVEVEIAKMEVNITITNKQTED